MYLLVSKKRNIFMFTHFITLQPITYYECIYLYRKVIYMNNEFNFNL
jgi:hypothetical protein